MMNNKNRNHFSSRSFSFFIVTFQCSFLCVLQLLAVTTSTSSSSSIAAAFQVSSSSPQLGVLSRRTQTRPTTTTFFDPVLPHRPAGRSTHLFLSSTTSSSSSLRSNQTSSSAPFFFTEPKTTKTTTLASASATRSVSSSSSSSTTTTTPRKAAATKPSTTTSPSTLVANKMNDWVYHFNKILIDTVYELICFLYPVTGSDRDYARFFVLETVARVPYFAYLSVLHLRETFGTRGNHIGDKMRTHYAEADNELHHLLIMESLGGNAHAADRWLAQLMAFVYYWYVVAVYFCNEAAAYHLSELIEDHAYHTYDSYLQNHGALLQTKPVPDIAYKYYVEDNPYMMDCFRTVPERDETTGQLISTRQQQQQQPSSSSSNDNDNYNTLQSLYDVFVHVRDDEKEHWKTLCNLVQYDDMRAVEAQQVQPTQPQH